MSRIILGAMSEQSIEPPTPEPANVEGKDVALLQRIAAAAPGIFFQTRFDRQGRQTYEFVSERARSLLGLEVEAGDATTDGATDAIGSWSLVVDDDVDATRAGIAKGIASGEVFELEYRVRNRDGARWVRTRAQPHPPAPDGSVLLTCFSTDVTAEKLAALSAAVQTQVMSLLERIATGAPTPEILDQACRAVEARIPGALASVMLLDRSTNAVRYGAAPTLSLAYMQALEGVRVGPDVGSCGTALHFGTTVISPDLHADPKWRAYLPITEAYGLGACWSTPFFGADGKPTGTFAVYFPKPRVPSTAELDALRSFAHVAGIATQRAEAERTLHETEEQLRQAQKMEAVGQLAGGIAHDFNNLLTVIRSSAELLLEESTDATARGDLELIREAARRAEGLTRQLLAFSRRQAWQPTVTNVDEVVSRVETMLRRMIGEHVTLRTSLSTMEPVLVDASQLEQVLLNLAVNARDAMPHGGELEVETSVVQLPEPEREMVAGLSPGAHVRIDVRDSGEGMDDATRRRLFEPFFTTKPPGKGTGLGLATVYGIVHRAGGAIEVDTEPGAGTTFRIYLPVTDQRHEGRARSSTTTRVPEGRGDTVLLVEDDDLVRLLAARVLRERGFEVVEASDGKAALEALEARDGRVSLLLSDVVMPVMGGRALAERARMRWPALPVLFMSGYTDDLSLLREVLHEGTPLLAKPFTPADLARRVRETIDLSSERQARAAGI